MSPTVHAVHGFLGSGKTTFARQLAARLPALRLNADEWLVRLYGADPPEDHFGAYLARVQALQRELAAQWLRLGQDVVLGGGAGGRIPAVPRRAAGAGGAAAH